MLSPVFIFFSELISTTCGRRNGHAEIVLPFVLVSQVGPGALGYVREPLFCFSFLSPR